jgi:hypothetical protein
MEISTTFIKVFDFNVLDFGYSKGYYRLAYVTLFKTSVKTP